MIPTDVMEAVTQYLAAKRDNGQDAKVIANHCLPWLDQTPIDAAWIQSLGAVETANGTYWRLQSPVHSVYWLIRQNHLIVEMRDNTTRTVTATTNATRGQLLMLLTALGVTCKEANNG